MLSRAGTRSLQPARESRASVTATRLQKLVTLNPGKGVLGGPGAPNMEGEWAGGEATSGSLWEGSRRPQELLPEFERRILNSLLYLGGNWDSGGRFVWESLSWRFGGGWSGRLQ